MSAAFDRLTASFDAQHQAVMAVINTVSNPDGSETAMAALADRVDADTKALNDAIGKRPPTPTP